MLARFWRNSSGMTLIELAIVLGIMSLVFSALYGLLISGYKQWDYSDQRIEEYQNARSGMTRIVREVRYSLEVVNISPDYPTNSYSLSVRGIPVSGRQLSTADYRSYTVNDGPWIDTAGAVVRVNGTVVSSGFTINYTTGVITFTSAQSSSAVITADYTRNAYLRYYLSGTDLRRSVNGVDTDVVARFVINQAVSTPIFTWEATNLVRVNLLIDRDTTKEPRRFTLQSRVRLRV